MDHSRVNEFGFSGDMLEEAENKNNSEDKAIKDESQNGEDSKTKKENGSASQEQKQQQTKHKPKSAKAKKAD